MPPRSALRIVLATSIPLPGAPAAPPAAAAAIRADGRNCYGYDALKNDPALASGRIAAAGRTAFLKNESDDAACPAEGGGCLRKSFLVTGDGVLVSGRTGTFACATFVNGKGAETSGWMPAAAIATDPPSGDTTVQEWTGSWIREEARIAIRPAPGGKLAVKGDATFGASDPDRVRTGRVNIGEIAGTVGIGGDRLSFAMGDDGHTLPIDGGEAFACKVWMRRAGDYLLVDDNGNCGGMNVSFAGTYVRR